MKTTSGPKHSVLLFSGDNPVLCPFKRFARWAQCRRRARPLLTILLLIVATCNLAYAHSDGANPRGDARSSVMPQTDLKYSAATVSIAPADPAIQRALAEISPAQIEHTISALASFYNRNTLSSMDPGLPPAGSANARGATAAAEWIEAELRRYSTECGGCLDVHRDTFTEPAGNGSTSRIPRPTTITNVYALLRGSDPAQAKRMFLVTGHYDSRGNDVLDTRKQAPGANDDASGVAVSLESARVLSKLRLPATLVFVAVAGEEQGLNGSAHLAHLARTEGWQLEAVLNNDIVGGDTTPGDTMQDKSLVRIFSEGIPTGATPDQIKATAALGGEGDSPSRELARAIADVATTYFPRPRQRAPSIAASGHTPHAFQPVLEFRRDRYLRGGDHTSFNSEGFAAIRFTEWRENFNHQHQDVRTENGIEYGDLLKFVDFHYVANVVRLNAATLATLASAPPPPEAVKMETRALDNNTTLKWTAAEDSNPAGEWFEVVWRATAAPDWQFAHPCDSTCVEPGQQPGRQFRVTLPVSKDDYIFGVRAIDARGHRGLVVIPTAER